MSKIAAAASTKAKPTANRSVASLNQPAERRGARYPANNTIDGNCRRHRQRKLPWSAWHEMRDAPDPKRHDDRRADRGERTARRAALPSAPRGPQAQWPAAQSPAMQRAHPRQLRRGSPSARAAPDSRSPAPAGRSVARPPRTRARDEIHGESGEHQQPVHDQPCRDEIEPHDLGADGEGGPADRDRQHETVERVAQSRAASARRRTCSTAPMMRSTNRALKNSVLPAAGASALIMWTAPRAPAPARPEIPAGAVDCERRAASASAITAMPSADQFPGQIAEPRRQATSEHQQADDGVRRHSLAPPAEQPRRRRKPDARDTTTTAPPARRATARSPARSAPRPPAAPVDRPCRATRPPCRAPSAARRSAWPRAPPPASPATET